MVKLFVAVAFIISASTLAATAMPGGWCGSYARTHLVSVDPGPQFNLACNWLRWGRPTTAHVGAIVVWCSKTHRHVGKITGVDANGSFIVLSGNDDHAVRERVRSVTGAQFRE